MLTPTNEAEIAEAIRASDGSISIRGGGTRGLSADGTSLTTSGHSGITLYEPGALTIVAKTGTPVAEIEAALAAENQMLAFEPMDYRPLLGTDGEPTIGGVVASNTSGPRRVQAGACRDFLLGVRFVDGTGSIVKNGGRVMKNVTGYDLARLMCGAHGTLGVLSEVSLKVLPKPEATATLLFDGLGHTATQAVLTRAMQSPFDVTGAARLPAGSAGERGAAILRLEGFEGSVKYRSKALTEWLNYNEGTSRLVTDPTENEKLWKTVRDVTPFADRDGDIWHLSIKPTDFLSLSRIDQEDKLVDWACGRVWVCVPPGTDMRLNMEGVSGHATLVRSSSDLLRFQPEAEPLAKLAAGLRQKFDPRGILNPGLMG